MVLIIGQPNIFHCKIINGFDILVGNPPYAPLGERRDYASLVTSYHCLAAEKGGTRDNTFPLFIEMMWRLTVPGASAASLVTPLSIAFHRGAQYEACRNERGAVAVCLF